MQRKLLWTILKVATKILFTSLLIFLVFNTVDINDIREIFGKSKPQFIVAAIIAYLLSIIVSSWRLEGFLKSIKINIGLLANLQMYFIGLFYNIFLPGGLGGEGYKIYLLHKQSLQPLKPIFWAVFLDRFSGLWSIALILTIFIGLVPGLKSSLPTILIAFLFGTVIYYIVLKKFFAVYSKQFILTHSQAIIAQSLQMLCVAFILLSQPLNGNYIPYLFSFLISSVATIIPVSIGGFGLREYVMLHSSSYLHMNTQVAVFLTLSFSFLSTILSLPGLWYVHRLKLKMKPRTADAQ
jgi:glycosyltransferase 2 family protein